MYRPLTPFNCQLPAVGMPLSSALLEREFLDFKLTAETTSAFHLAKDVASFANHLGGTILVGAKEERGVIAHYAQMSAAESFKARTLYSQAVAQRCRPTVEIGFEVLPVPGGGGEVLAVNVSPTISPPVAVTVSAVKEVEDFGGAAFVFPIRVGTDTDYLGAERLHMYMDPRVRRALITLARLKAGDTIHMWYRRMRNIPAAFTVQFVETRPEENALVVHHTGRPGDLRTLPIDQIETIYWDVKEKRWAMLFAELPEL